MTVTEKKALFEAMAKQKGLSILRANLAYEPEETKLYVFVVMGASVSTVCCIGNTYNHTISHCV